MTQTTVKIGIIGGSGLEDPSILIGEQQKTVTTPFGDPSDVLQEGLINGVPCVLLSRHGRKHSLSPTNVNYRANVWALKSAGCTHIVVSTACGSLREEIVPGEVVILDQFIDRTCKRQSSFFDGTKGGPVGVSHIPMGEPFCLKTRDLLIKSAQELGIKHHDKGTCVCIEGPRFSTKAESHMFRSWGAHIVNMTTVPEACLAKEVGISYAAVALPTDYDCWRDGEEAVSVEMVMKTFKDNASKATDIIKLAVKKIAEQDWTEYIKQQKLNSMNAVMLSPDAVQIPEMRLV